MAAPTPAGTANVAQGLLAEAQRALGARPDLALVKAREALAAAPGRLDAQLMLGAALRRSGDPAEAVRVLAPLADAASGAWGIQFELGAAFATLGDTPAAIAHLSRATQLNPGSSLALHALGDQLTIQGDHRAARQAHGRVAPGAPADARLHEGVAALARGDLAKADGIFRDRFGLHPTDPTAVRLIADAAMRLGEHGLAESLLSPLMERAPGFVPARAALALLLLVRQRPREALALAEPLVGEAPRSALSRSVRGEARRQVADDQGALEDFAAALDLDAEDPRVWLSWGHALRAVGRRAEAVSAYRRCLALAPTLGEAYWSLADLKVVRFDVADRAAMGAALAREDLAEEDRANLHFALGKALEDEADFAAAFDHYAKGNRLRRASRPYDWAANRDYVRRTTRTFTPAFLAERQGVGDPAQGPIFVLGLPRSGSTLVEQILASHSAVEGLSELPDLMVVAGRLQADGDPESRRYPDLLEALPLPTFAELGAAYLGRTRLYRRLDRPLFVDKAPGNVMQMGLIHLILPNARIVEVRREPMACGLSIFKQNFARGAAYSHSLEDIGRYYRDYLALTAHFDDVLPGRVHRVVYEDLVRDPQVEVERLLAWCGLAFEPACLRFHESARAVRTASSEQVRRPLYAEALDHWRSFEPWLAPLRAGLA